MSSQIKISIPEPCHENWNRMSPNEKGRFCSVCAKGVIDFTTQSKDEIQDYFRQHNGEKVCGRFNNEQLNRFDIQIPAAVLQQKRTFNKAFLLALFVVMGASLFSCKNHSDDQLGEVVVVEDTIKEKMTMGVILPPKEIMDSVNKANEDSDTKRNIPPPATVKEIKIIKKKPKNKKVPPPPPVAGNILYVPIPDSTKIEKN